MNPREFAATVDDVLTPLIVVPLVRAHVPGQTTYRLVGRAATGPVAGHQPIVTSGRPRAAACRSSVAATPTIRTGQRPERAQPTCSTAWRHCTRRRGARTPAPCRYTGSSSRAPWARANGSGTAISRNLWTTKRGAFLKIENFFYNFFLKVF